MKRIAIVVLRGLFDLAMFAFGVGLVISFGENAFRLHTPVMRAFSGILAVLLAAALVVAVRNALLNARDRRVTRRTV